MLEWKAQYPAAGATPKPKQEWIDALAEVKKQGKIPDFPVATIKDGLYVLLAYLRQQSPSAAPDTSRHAVYSFSKALRTQMESYPLISRDATAHMVAIQRRIT